MARQLRGDGDVAVPPRVLAAAKNYIRNRKQYDARRARVRAFAAEIRAGNKPRIPREFQDAVEKHIAYREKYNTDRRAMRQR